MTSEERVYAFLEAMVEWELRTYPQCTTAPKPLMQTWSAELRRVFDEHLTAKGKGPKAWGKRFHPTHDIPTHFSDPPQWALAAEPELKRGACALCRWRRPTQSKGSTTRR